VWGNARFGLKNMNMTELLGRDGERFVHLWIMIRLHQISKRHDTFEAFLQSSGISKGTLWKLMRGEGNPTISLLQRIADSQKMSFIELLGLDPESVQKDLEKVGIDAEQLASFSKGEKRTRKTLAKMLEKSGA
jgi:transcriptional regulator with XRE-family HTH domain